MTISATTLKDHLNDVLYKDQFRLKRRIDDLRNLKTPEKVEASLTKIAVDIQVSMDKRKQRLDNLPEVSYPDLPVSQKKDEIAEAIANNQVVIIAGETGSGKTTQIPKICLELGRGVSGLIGHTQPRRLAARTVANRIADELDSELGETVGYRVRFTDKVSDKSYIKLMTDGILLAEIQNDRFLSQYDTIIIDEAHERSLNIDFLMGYLKRLLPRRPDLKVIITSATIDPERFANHFSDKRGKPAPIIEVSGRTFPVETLYRPLDEYAAGDQIEGIFQAVDELQRLGRGDILIFMNGEREIRDTADALTKRKLRDTEVLPLFARLSVAEQNKIFQGHRGQRIVLATNVAETSLTIPGIKYVIDTGTVRISRYSYRTKVQRLPIEAISQASANQRKGRCGRVSEGVCIRLYSEEDFNGRPEFTDPEILRTNLSSVILQMLSLGLGELNKFPFVEPPEDRNIKDGLNLLEELGAVNLKAKDPRKKLTGLGRQLAKLPVDPRLARMILAAKEFNCVHEVMVISAALSIQDPRERPMDKQQASDEKHRRFYDKESDFITYVNLWNYINEQREELTNNNFRKMCQKDFLAYMRVREWQDIYTQIKQVTDELDIKVSDTPSSFDAIHQALLAGLLSHIGLKDKDAEYLGARNSKFYMFPGSGLFKKQPKWGMFAELVETSKLFARVAARIKPEWVEQQAQHLIKRSYAEPHWQKKSGVVGAFETQTLYGIPIVSKRRVVYTQIDPVLCRELFIRHALVEGEFETRHQFFKDNQALLNDIEELEHKSRRRDILVDDETLFLFYDEIVPQTVCSAKQFDSWWNREKKQQPDLLNYQREQVMAHDADKVTANAYPDFWQQGDFRLKLEYAFEPGTSQDGVTVNIPLALLNQVSDQGFDWQIPALREELLIALIKTLPKAIRRNFVPAPNYAEAAMANLVPLQGSLLEAFEKQLLRMTGVRIPEDSWDVNALPTHLRIKFNVVDDKQKSVAVGTDLKLLQHDLKGKVKQTLSNVSKQGIEKSDLVEWDFGKLPKSFKKDHGGYEVKAYPALVDKNKSVAIELFDSEDKAQRFNQAGVRRLILLNVPSPIKYLQQSLPNKAKLGLYFNPFGQIKDLIDDCISCAVDAILDGEVHPQEAPEFEAQKEKVRAELADKTLQITQQVEEVLTLAHAVNKQLKGKADLTMLVAKGDIKSQLERLIFPGFVCQVGEAKLNDIKRYLLALQKRLEKLPVNPNQDRLNTIELHELEERYRALCKQLLSNETEHEGLAEVYWMMEELRVSLFAQQLGTPYPVSAKRVRLKLTELKG
ncbi:ATP-dependent RNA helicase HrpA [Psychromonas sp. 14N.309.X.WAT.B.A12]|uniref:ATP-dependent RNA helicase HrpA n=1 Tax=Psychromonas sp. 14N.309.X.WAT.B.A12 TaxID=2998322 RepID=UPI0025B27EDA|nr:ATP-dependent RNA helicase HrpA [Psychromonas sp. 14N.309.X.WAT.B.A12]MDN2662494.1 ATP-dependent RNA helicase HrpA [Psychromonas sp. 14N.309.X.WAT.B.A12]